MFIAITLTFLMKPQGAHLPRIYEQILSLLFFLGGGMQHSLWDLRFLTRDHTHAPYIGRAES